MHSGVHLHALAELATALYVLPRILEPLLHGYTHAAAHTLSSAVSQVVQWPWAS